MKTRGPELAPPLPLTRKEQLYYDMPAPEIPQTAFGVESQHILTASKLIGNVAVHAPESFRPAATYAEKAGKYGEEMLRMTPLLEQVARREEITPEDVRPYRAVIKDIARQESTGFRWLERGAKFFAFFGIRGPQRMLNKYVEKQFVKRVPEKFEQIRSFVQQRVDNAIRFVDEFMPHTEETQADSKADFRQPETLKDYVVMASKALPNDIRTSIYSLADSMVHMIPPDFMSVEDEKDTASETKTKKTRRKKSVDLRLLWAKWKAFRMKRKNRVLKRSLNKAAKT